MDFNAAERKELLHFATAWMELESIMPGSERQIPYDLTFNRNLIIKTNKQNMTKDTETEKRPKVTRGERGVNFRGKGWRVCRKNYKEHRDNKKWGWGMGGRWGGLGVSLGWGEKAENCTWTTIKLEEKTKNKQKTTSFFQILIWSLE